MVCKQNSLVKSPAYSLKSFSKIIQESDGCGGKQVQGSLYEIFVVFHPLKCQFHTLTSLRTNYIFNQYLKLFKP